MKRTITPLLGFVFFIFLFAAVSCDCEEDDSADDEDDDDTASDDDDDDDDISDDDAVDTEAPFVVSTSPANGDVELKLATEVTVTFSEPMDQESVENNFTCLGASGTFAWNAAGDEVTFTPDDLLEEAQEYLVTLGEGARNLFGNNMETNFIFSFQTVDLWTRTYDGAAGGFDNGMGIAVDPEGNVYATGYVQVDGMDHSIWAGKYSRDGNETWTLEYEFGESDLGAGLALDGDQNVLLIGQQSPFTVDIWLRKMDVDGDEIWTRTFNGDSNLNDWGNGVAVHENGDVYAIGTETAAGQQNNIWLRKYDEEGTVQWTFTYNGSANGFDQGYDVAAGGDGQVYAVGTEDGDIWLSKFDDLGTKLWTRNYNGAAGYSDSGNGIAVDDEGNLFIIGEEGMDSKNGHFNVWIGKYDTDGGEQWSFLWGEDLRCFGYDIALDAEGNLWAAGMCDTVWVGKFDPDGNELWTTMEGAIGAEGIAVDGHGNGYVVGCSEGDIWIRKFDPDGHWAE